MPAAQKVKRILRFKGSTQIGARTISKKDFAKVGADSVGDVSWDKDNTFMVDATDWPESAVELVKAQPGFSVLEGDKISDKAADTVASNTPDA